MKQYIDKSAVVAEIEKTRRFAKRKLRETSNKYWQNHFQGCITACRSILSFLDTFEVKEVDEQKEWMSKCPYRQVGCKMYEGKILECNGACGWVVDHLNLKELKAQKGE